MTDMALVVLFHWVVDKIALTESDRLFDRDSEALNNINKSFIVGCLSSGREMNGA